MPEAMIRPEAGTAGVDSPLVRTASIAGLGTALPSRNVTNEEISERLGIDADWIHQRTGIIERRFAGEDESLTALAIAASQRALAAAALEPADLDIVLVATFTADRLLPNAAPLVADALGARGAFACDIGAACTGFLSALALACGQIECGRAEHALIVGADVMSRVLDHDDRKTAGLFADGAGAVIVGPGDAGRDGRIGPVLMRSDATEAECITVDHDERKIRMRGQDTFRAAVDSLSKVTLEVLSVESLSVEDVDLFVYHQANARITRAVGERLGLPFERVIDCIERTGNTSAASLPLALDRAAADDRLHPGSSVLVAAFGAGFVWGGGLITWSEGITS